MYHHVWLLRRCQGSNSGLTLMQQALLLTELSPQFRNGFSNSAVWWEMPGRHWSMNERPAPAHGLYQQLERGSATAQHIYEQGCSGSSRWPKSPFSSAKPLKPLEVICLSL